MKKMLSLLLTLTFLLCAVSAPAQSYVPGEIAQGLLGGAFDTGRHLSLSLSGIFEPGETLLAEDDEAQLLALSELLSRSALRVGYAGTDEGPRFELGGYVYDEEGQVAYSDNAITLTRSGLILESDLLEGRRYTVRWETLSNRLDLDGEARALFLSLEKVDWQNVAQDLIQAMATFEERVSAHAVPYLETMAAWAAALPRETVDRVEGNALIPITPGMTKLTLRPSDLGALLSALLDQLAQDKALTQAMDMVLLLMASDNPDSMSEEEPDGGLTASTDASSLISMLRGLVGLTEEVPFALTLTFTPEEALPFSLYAELLQGEQSLLTSTFVLQPGEQENTGIFVGNLSTSFPDEPFLVDLNGQAAWDPQDEQAITIDYDLSATSGGKSVFQITYGLASEALKTEDDQPGYAVRQTEAVQVFDIDEQSNTPVYDLSTQSSITFARTEAGGERFQMSGSEQIEDPDSPVLILFDADGVIEPEENGHFSGHSEGVYRFPDLGVEAAGYSALFFGDSYESLSGELDTFALEDLDGDALAALENEFMRNARARRDQLLRVMPEALRWDASDVIGGKAALEDLLYEGDGFCSDDDALNAAYQQGYDDGFRAGYQMAIDLRSEQGEAPIEAPGPMDMPSDVPAFVGPPSPSDD